MGKPVLIGAARAHRSGSVRYLKNGTACIKIPDISEIRIPRARQFDLTEATIFGLNERLTSTAASPIVGARGRMQKTLRDVFNAEWQRYARALERAEDAGSFNYGIYALYRGEQTLVRYASPKWHRIVAIASSSTLLTDPRRELSWQEVQSCFAKTTIAVAGGSVGGNVLHCAVMDMRPAAVKIADKSVYKMENINRVRLRYDELVSSNEHRSSLAETLLRNKAEVLATQLYAIDPFLRAYVYAEGITHETLGPFLDGTGREPAVDIIVEEVDDPRTKILLREAARERRLPLIMVSDFGSAVQLDVSRYDLNPSAPLAYGTEDALLRTRTDALYERVGDRDAFFDFVDALAGTDYRTGELAAILRGSCEIPTSTIIPQLGSTAAMAGAIAAETIARVRLGHRYPSRVVMNKHTCAVKRYE